MRVTVDRTEVEVPEGATVIDAIHSAGAEIPSLCWDSRLSPAGSCRTCMVGLEGSDRPVPACTTPAVPGARIRTDEPAAVSASRGALELILSALPERALEIGADRSELTETCARLGLGSSPAADGRRRTGEIDASHPYVRYDPSLCIACTRCVRICDEVQGTFALAMGGRGFETVLVPGADEGWAASDCVSCGACVDTCPTGALSEDGLLDPRPIERTVTTTCGYCGVGCTLDVATRGDEIAAIHPNRDAPVNRGHACVKGRFAHGFARSPERLQRPLIRRDGKLVECSWDQALERIGSELRRIVAAHGPDAVAAISSARATNEENYLMQKLMRVAVGTNNVDNCARICHAPSAAGLTASFGLAGGTNCFEDFDRAGCFLIAGANPTEAHPVIGARIKQRVIRGAGLVVVDPREIELARYADVHLRPRPGTNVAVFNGLARVLADEGLLDDSFLAERASGLGELRELLGDYGPERVELISGVPAADLRAAARLYGNSAGRTLIWGLGVTEHRHGTDGVRALCNLAILTGSVGTDDGFGANPLRGQNNVQGASDMGAMPDVLPGYQPTADPEAARRFGERWGVEIRPRRGLRIPEMFNAAIAGSLKGLIVFGEDIAQTDPDTAHVEAALDACELVVSQELFLSRTAQRADVVLPAASFLEKDGTFTNFDRRVQRVRPALRPPGEARSDFEIIAAIGRALGRDLGCATPADAFAEMASLTPTFAGISHLRLDREGPLHWPCRSESDPGEARLYGERFETDDGRAQLASLAYLEPGESTDGEYPIALITGRRLEHYNSGTMTRRTANLSLAPAERLELNPVDATELGVGDGADVVVESRRGSVRVRADLTARVSPGQAFMSFHFPDALANKLTSQWEDETTGCPEYKVSAVRVRAA